MSIERKVNFVQLIGNMGSEARNIDKDDSKLLAAFSIATQESYKDQEENWQRKDTVWHNVIVFSKKVAKVANSLKSGTRIKLTGELSYRPFEIEDEDGKIITKNEASVIARKIEVAPL